MLQILSTKPLSAKENMDMDALLLESIDRSLDPILRFHSWKSPSFTYGYFTPFDQYISSVEEMQKRGIDSAKRPTGGGITCHAYDLSFAFLLPSSHRKFSSDTLENYAFVNTVVKNALMECFPDAMQLFSTKKEGASTKKMAPPSPFCMAKPTKYDVVLEEKDRGKSAGIKKIAGAAQRRKRSGYLHQGTISIAQPKLDLLSPDIIPDASIRDAIFFHSYTPLQGNWQEEDLQNTRYKLRLLLIQHFRRALDNSFE